MHYEALPLSVIKEIAKEKSIALVYHPNYIQIGEGSNAILLTEGSGLERRREALQILMKGGTHGITQHASSSSVYGQTQEHVGKQD